MEQVYSLDEHRIFYGFHIFLVGLYPQFWISCHPVFGSSTSETCHTRLGGSVSLATLALGGSPASFQPQQMGLDAQQLSFWMQMFLPGSCYQTKFYVLKMQN